MRVGSSSLSAAREKVSGAAQLGVEHGLTFGPLNGLVSVRLLGHLLDLPGTPCFISKGPVLDLHRVCE
jgi:hypothetical protein